jgi:hypothetical protein
MPGIGQVGHRHRRHGGARGLRQLGGDRLQKPRLVDRAVVHIKAKQLDEVRGLGIEPLEDALEMADHHGDLRPERALMQHLAGRGQIDLAADPDHLPAAQPMLVRDLDRPSPMTIRPDVTPLHPCLLDLCPALSLGGLKV